MPDAHHSVFATYLRYQIHCCGPTISRYNQIVNFNPMESEPSSSIQPCRHFEFLEILTATNNFDESLVIGKGGFGKVYKGSIIIESCLVLVAIKRLDFMSNQGPTEFWAEVEMLSNLRHCNLVYLIGHCNHENEKEMILVYEYMSNGTLYDHLHKLRTPVSWLQRLNICIGAGRGLHYLHTGTGIQYGVIHRDIKSSNILLHENWAAKISDFGLSKIGPTNQPSTYVNTNVKGTFGYLDPNYFTTGKLTRRSDVYAFGVVLLEVLCRKRAVDRTLDEEEWGLVTWAQDSIKEGNLKRIIDSDIRDEVSPKCLKEFVRIAERCLHYSPKQRPTMGEVVFTLESIMALQEKFTNSVQVAGRTLFSRMVDKLLFTSNGENSGDSKLSSSRNDKNKLPEMENAHTDSQSPSPSLKVFKSADLSMATRGFSQDLQGITGYFGEVFLGWVDQNTLAPSKEGVGIAVAVERLKQDSDALAEWLREANILGQLAHPNIIRLLGYCCDEFEHLLVYENLSNNSLDHLLFRNRAKPLSWSTRLSIMIGVARGLTCLHSIDCIHHELKSSTISLDEVLDFNAKLWGFRLKTYFIAETTISDPNFTTWVAGPDGYVAPEFFLTGCFTRKSDIYSFGIVLLESITGQKALDRNRSAKGQQSLVHWATLNQNNRRVLKTLIDPCLKSMKDPPKGAFKCFALALRCTVFKPKDRPSSEEILRSLEQIYAQYLQQTEGKL